MTDIVSFHYTVLHREPDGSNCAFDSVLALGHSLWRTRRAVEREFDANHHDRVFDRRHLARCLDATGPGRRRPNPGRLDRQLRQIERAATGWSRGVHEAGQAVTRGVEFLNRERSQGAQQVA